MATAYITDSTEPGAKYIIFAVKPLNDQDLQPVCGIYSSVLPLKNKLSFLKHPI